MTPIVLLELEGAILVVGGGIVGALTGSWEVAIGTQAVVIACVVAIHMIKGGARWWWHRRRARRKPPYSDPRGVDDR